jgi:hypothetical protein
MAISAYQVHGVINAYNRQSRTNNSPSASPGLIGAQDYTDKSSHSAAIEQNDAFQKISYSLLEVILKDKL